MNGKLVVSSGIVLKDPGAKHEFKISGVPAVVIFYPTIPLKMFLKFNGAMADDQIPWLTSIN